MCGPRGGRRRAGRARGRRRAGRACPCGSRRAPRRASPWARRRRSRGAPRALALARVLGAADAQHHLERHLGVPRRLAAERREARVVADLPLALVEARRAEVGRRAWPRAATAAPGRRPRAGPGRAAAGRAPSSSSSRARCRCASRPCPAARRPRPWFALAARDAFERACSRDAFSALAAFERACCCSLARSPAQQCVRSRRSNSTDARRRARTITANFDKRRNASRGR